MDGILGTHRSRTRSSSSSGTS